jgi:hypothetical protein
VGHPLFMREVLYEAFLTLVDAWTARPTGDAI